MFLLIPFASYIVLGGRAPNIGPGRRRGAGTRNRGTGPLGLNLAPHLGALARIHHARVSCHGSYGTKGGARCVSQLGAGRRGVSRSWARAPNMKAALCLCNTRAGPRRGVIANRRGRLKSRPKPASMVRDRRRRCRFFFGFAGFFFAGFFDCFGIL
jgi:hypothetical protein